MFDLGSLCPDAIPSVLGFFDFSVAPPLLFYSYIPIVLASLFVGLYILRADPREKANRLFFYVTVFFILWVLNILVQWIAAHESVVMFAWQLTAVFEVGLFFSTLYFAYIFLYKRDISNTWKVVMLTAALCIIELVPTPLNMSAFDVGNCEGVTGPLWLVIYALEPAVVVLMIALGIRAFRSEQNGQRRKQILFFTTGSGIFLGTFFVSNYYGELTRVYEFNLWGPIGLACFLILLGYMMVRYSAFNAKVLGAEALVFVLLLLIGSEFFFVRSQINHILVGVTFAFTLGFGYMLIRSVRAEVRQRELIEQQGKELAVANQQQESLLHFISHEIKGYLTKNEAAFDAIHAGDYGSISDELKTMSANALTDTRKGVATVIDILDASNFKKGTVAYAKADFDLTAALQDVVAGLIPAATEKGLSLSYEKPSASFVCTGDIDKLSRHVLRNVIDNSIKYTPTGSVSVALARQGNNARITVQDTGVGITPEDMAKLFTEGGHGKDSIKVNVHSTGYGLYIAKQVVEAHGGKIWAESEGSGKGSRFLIELPLKA